jgi:hypothetical protein
VAAENAGLVCLRVGGYHSVFFPETPGAEAVLSTDARGGGRLLQLSLK